MTADPQPPQPGDNRATPQTRRPPQPGDPQPGDPQPGDPQPGDTEPGDTEPDDTKQDDTLIGYNEGCPLGLRPVIRRSLE